MRSIQARRRPHVRAHLEKTLGDNDFSFTDGTEARIFFPFHSGPTARFIVSTNVGGVRDEMSLTEFSRRFPEHMEAVNEEMMRE